MDLGKLPKVSIKGQTTPGDRAEFTMLVNRVRHTVNPLSLRLHSVMTEPINQSGDDPQAIGALFGRQYVAELVGDLRPGEGRGNRQFVVGITFVHFAAHDNYPAQLSLKELCVGIVPADDSGVFDRELGDVLADIIRFEHIDATGQVRPLPDFPLEWRDMIAGWAMAITLANQ